MAVSNEGRKIGNLIVSLPNPLISIVPGILRNNTGTERTLTDPIGYPLIAGTNGADYNLAVVGNEASVIALLLDLDGKEAISEVFAANTNVDKKWRILRRPPVCVNQNQIRTADIAGANFTMATILTALKAVGWEIRDIPELSTLQ